MRDYIFTALAFSYALAFLVIYVVAVLLGRSVTIPIVMTSAKTAGAPIWIYYAELFIEGPGLAITACWLMWQAWTRNWHSEPRRRNQSE